eukprot:2966691-Rhodomonas_salina.1
MRRTIRDCSSRIRSQTYCTCATEYALRCTGSAALEVFFQPLSTPGRKSRLPHELSLSTVESIAPYSRPLPSTAVAQYRAHPKADGDISTRRKLHKSVPDTFRTAPGSWFLLPRPRYPSVPGTPRDVSTRVKVHSIQYEVGTGHCIARAHPLRAAISPNPKSEIPWYRDAVGQYRTAHSMRIKARRIAKSITNIRSPGAKSTEIVFDFAVSGDDLNNFMGGGSRLGVLAICAANSNELNCLIQHDLYQKCGLLCLISQCRGSGISGISEYRTARRECVGAYLFRIQGCFCSGRTRRCSSLVLGSKRLNFSPVTGLALKADRVLGTTCF